MDFSDIPYSFLLLCVFPFVLFFVAQIICILYLNQRTSEDLNEDLR